VRGVVNGSSDESWSSFFFADESGGIYISPENDITVPVPVMQNGQLASSDSFKEGLEIEVDGVTSPGGYAPVIVPKEIRIVGRRSLYPPRKVTLDSLQAGAGDGQRVQLERLVVQSVVDDEDVADRVLRACSASGNSILLVVKPAPWNEPARVVDAEVLVSGIVMTLYNSRQEITGLLLLVTQPEDFEIVKQPPVDAFASPRIEIGGLRLFRAEGGLPHRHTVEGTVTLISSDGLVIQDGGRGIEVKNLLISGLQIGDRVKVTGFVEARQTVAFLTNGLVRKLAAGNPPEALATSPEEIIKLSKDNVWRGWDKFPDDFDRRLVRLEGTLIGDIAPGASTFSVQTKSGQTFEVQFASGSRLLETPPTTGSLLSLTGVALVRHTAGNILPEFVQPTSVDLLLRGPGDVQVLRTPPWWNARRLLIVLSFVALAAALSFAWVLQLRRRVSRHATAIEETLRTHHNAELTQEAAKRERLRLAGDLHDGVHQLLTAASYRLENAEELALIDPPAALTALGLAKHTLGRSQHELRSLLWGIHQVATAPSDFSELLAQALSNMDHWPAGVVEVSSQGTPQLVPPRAAGSLLLLSQEAVENALRHGKATSVDVVVHYTSEMLVLTIQDNGSGFDITTQQPTPQGGLGLGNMRRRAAELLGTFTLRSGATDGTFICVELPWKQLRKLFPVTHISSLPI
jgi:signal transduction histidine kinase